MNLELIFSANFKTLYFQSLYIGWMPNCSGGKINPVTASSFILYFLHHAHMKVNKLTDYSEYDATFMI